MGPTSKVKAGWADRLAVGAFVAALCGVAFAYGVAVAPLKLFPHRQLVEARSAFEAWRQVGDDQFPSIVLGWEERLPAKPATTLDPRAGDEAILITGGFYSRLDLCPRTGCIAWLTDRKGKVLRAWSAPDAESFFADAKGHSGRLSATNFYFFGLAPAPDGGFVATFHGKDMFPYQVGMAKFDKDGRVAWKRFGSNHHYLTVGRDGRTYAPFMRLAEPGKTHFGGAAVENTCRKGGRAYLEGIQVISLAGETLKEFPIEPALAAAGYPGLFYSIRDACDPFHVNSVDLLNPAAARTFGGRQGDLLVSVREANTLVVMDQDDGRILSVITGRVAAQHSPRVLPDGSFVVFDNLGGDRRLGGSRVARLDGNGVATTLFPRGNLRGITPFFSRYQGFIDVSRDGARMLVSSSMQGRIVEFDSASGAPLWTYETVVNMGPFIRARGIRHQRTAARVEAYGAHYVSDPALLRAWGIADPSIRDVGGRARGKD